MPRLRLSLLVGTLVLSPWPGLADEPKANDTAPPSSGEKFHVLGLPEQSWLVILDTGAIAHAALKNEWGGLTTEQQEQFTGLFAQVLHGTYAKLKRTYHRQQVTLAGEDQRSDGLFVRRFSCQPRDPNDLALEFQLVFSRDEQGECLVKDWIVDGVSTVRVYRSQFLKILSKDGFSTLIEKLRTKIARDQTELGNAP